MDYTLETSINMSSGNQDIARPGLRERRLSRVHFDGDEMHVPPMTLDTPAPLEFRRHSTEVDSGRQEYFDAPAPVQSSPSRNTRIQENRPTHFPEPSALVNPIIPTSNQFSEQRSSISAPMPPTNMDISPRSTAFAPADASQSRHTTSIPGNNLQGNVQTQYMPQHPYSAHFKDSPRLPSEPFNVPLSVYASPRFANHHIHDTSIDRSNASMSHPAGLTRARAATQSRGGRHSVDTWYPAHNSAQDVYTTIPPRVHQAISSPARQQDSSALPSMLLHQQANGVMVAEADTYKPSPEYLAYTYPAPPYIENMQNKPAQPLKPALRRTQTQEEARRVTRDAVDIVHAHTQGLRKRRGENDKADSDQLLGAGVLSNLLQLYGTSSVPQRSNSNDSQYDNQAMSRATSVSSYLAPTRGKLERMDSNASMATTLYEEDLDPHDPRLREQKSTNGGKLAPVGTRTRKYSVSAEDGDGASIRSKRSFKDMMRRRKSFAMDEDALYSDLIGKPRSAPVKSKVQQRRLSITRNVAGKQNCGDCPYGI